MTVADGFAEAVDAEPVDAASASVDGATVADVKSAVALLTRRARNLSGEQASAQLHEVNPLADMVEALRIELVSTVTKSEIWRASDPNGTPASFMRNQYVLDHRQATAMVRAAHAFDRFPELAKAARDGCISRDKVDLILSVGLRNPRREAALGEFIAILSSWLNVFLCLACATHLHCGPTKLIL